MNPTIPAISDALIGALCCGFLILAAFKIIVCVTCAKALKRVPEQHRMMSPALVWL